MPESEPKPKLIELVAPGAGQGWKAVLRNGKPAVVHEIAVPPAEAQAAVPRLQRLYDHKHPSLSPVLAWGTDQQGIWVAVEPNEGTPLGTILSRGPLTPPAAADLGASVLSGVAALHEAGIAMGGFGATALRVTQNGDVRLAGHPAAAVRGAPSQSDLRADVRSCGMAICAAFGVDPAGAPAPQNIPPGLVVTMRSMASGAMGPSADRAQGAFREMAAALLAPDREVAAQSELATRAGGRDLPRVTPFLPQEQEKPAPASVAPPPPTAPTAPYTSPVRRDETPAARRPASYDAPDRPLQTYPAMPAVTFPPAPAPATPAASSAPPAPAEPRTAAPSVPTWSEAPPRAPASPFDQPSAPAAATNPPAPAPPAPAPVEPPKPSWTPPEPPKEPPAAPAFSTAPPAPSAPAPSPAPAPAPVEPPKPSWTPLEAPVWRPGETIPPETLGTGVRVPTPPPAPAPPVAPEPAPQPLRPPTAPARRPTVPRPPSRGRGPTFERPPWLVPAAVAVVIVLLLGIFGVIILSRRGGGPSNNVAQTSPTVHPTASTKPPSPTASATAKPLQSVPTYGPASADPITKVQFCTTQTPCKIAVGVQDETATTCSLTSCYIEVALYFSSGQKNPVHYNLKFFDRCSGQTTDLPGPPAYSPPGYAVVIPRDHWQVNIPSGVKAGALVAVADQPSTAASAPLLLGADSCA